MNQPIEPRREPRYSVTRGKNLEARLEWVVDGETVSETGRIKDLSAHGLRLVLSSKPPVKENVTLRMEIAELELDVSVTGEICWIEPATNDGWTLGCRLEGGLPKCFVERLALAGTVERREDARRTTSEKAMARWELEHDGDFPVWIENFSKNGMRLYATQPGKPGARLLIRFTDANENSRQFSATAVWQLEADDGAHYIGCTYNDVAAYGMLENKLQSNTLLDVNRLAPSLRLSSWCWVGLVAVFLWASWQIWLN